MTWREEKKTQRGHLDSSESHNSSAPVPQEVKIKVKGQRNNFGDRVSGTCVCVCINAWDREKAQKTKAFRRGGSLERKTG